MKTGNIEPATIIKVTFLLKRRAPTNLKTMEYFVSTGNYEVAHEKALNKLTKHLIILAERFRTTEEELHRYYSNIAMAKVDMILVD